MKLDISQLLREKGAVMPVSYEETGVPFEAAGQEIRFAAPLQVQGTLTNTGNYLVGKGTVKTAVFLNCHRCLKEYRYEIDVPWELFFVNKRGGNFDPPEDEEAEIIPFSKEEIDLAEPLQEDIILSLPIRWLCREDCPGLCPVCGADKATTQCDCQVDDIDPRLAVLKDLVGKDTVGKPPRGGGKHGQS